MFAVKVSREGSLLILSLESLKELMGPLLELESSRQLMGPLSELDFPKESPDFLMEWLLEPKRQLCLLSTSIS